MTEKTMLLWSAIFAAGAITYGIRIVPLFLARQHLSQESILIRFLEHASFAVIGGIISLSIQKQASADIGILGINARIVPALITLVVVFLTTLKIKNMLICLFIGVITYAGLVLLGL